MKVQTAKLEEHKCPMYDPKCVERVVDQIKRLRPENSDYDPLPEIEQKCGRYARGKHKGQLRGWASITVVREGGWQYLGPGVHNGRVLLPGLILSVNISDFWGKTYFFIER